MTAKNYHVNAVLLPHGTMPVDIWIVDRKFTFRPVEGAEDLPGGFVAAGLVDCHAHLSIDFAKTGLPHGDVQLVLENAQRHLRSGVLALRDAGYVQQLAISGVELPPLPIIKRSGWLVVPKGCFFPGVDVGKDTEPSELRARLEEVADEGLEWFKFIADFPRPDLNLFDAKVNYPINIVREAVAAAHARGIRVMAHSTGSYVGELIEAGVDAIEHGMSVTPDIVRLMAKHGTHWTPTVGSVEAHLLAAESRGAPSQPRLAWAARLQECFPLAASLGVPVLVGSDELAHGSIGDEMDAMVRHGMSLDQVIAAATSVGRQILRLPSIEEGAQADLVIWARDPRVDLKEVKRPCVVMAAGRLVDPGYVNA